MYAILNSTNASKCHASQTLRGSGAVPAVRQPQAQGRQYRLQATIASPATDRATYALLEGTFTNQSSAGAPSASMATVSAQPSVSQFPAVLTATARTAEQVAQEVEQQLQVFPQALVQAVEPEMYAALRKVLSGVQYHARAKMLIIRPKPADGSVQPAKQRRLPGMLCVVSAGPEDTAAVEQVKLVAEHMGCFVTTKSQLGVRDLPRLMEQLPALHAADAIVAVAGVDTSLPAALAGLVDAPVIALPTSTCSSGGLGGLGGLVAAVSSATMGVSCVGVDQPAAAATMAARMLRVAAARVEKLAAASAAQSAVQSAPTGASANGSAAANNVVPTMLDSLSLTPALSVAAK